MSLSFVKPGNVVNIGGQAVSVSGNMVSVSGQTVSVSGNIINTSGQVAIVSGQPMTVSGNMVSISGQPVNVSGNQIRVQAFDPSGAAWRDAWMSTSGGNSIKVDAGAINVASNVSGNVVRTVPDGATVTIRTASGLVCTSLSGGTQLPSLAGDRLTIRMDPNHSGSMFIGSTTNPPFSGMGFKLAPGDGITLQASNANVLQVFATTSGERVFFIMEDT